ncbi:MAG: hypothetical protein HFF36_10975 [Coprobacillus sp.]|nr:hypothetical protein [Coprobacillus sp.]
MRLLIDGDACPQKEQIYEISQKYQIQMIVFLDYAHVSNLMKCEVRYCEIGKDSVDLMIINEVKDGDIVITQDYGLASLVIVKGAKVLHTSGKFIHGGNIDELLMSRYVGYKERSRNKHVKGPKKRTYNDNLYFLSQLEKLLENES